MTLLPWLLAGVLCGLSWWHGWYMGRRAGFDEILRDFEQQDMGLDEIKRCAAERRRDA